jgi:hypothetical protein
VEVGIDTFLGKKVAAVAMGPRFAEEREKYVQK